MRRELEKAEALDPSRTKTLYLLGRLYVLDNENEKAVPFLGRALQLQPNLNEASGLLGTAYVRMGQFADAVPRLEKAAALDHFGNIHYQLFQAYRKLGETELAQKALARSQDIRRSSLWNGTRRWSWDHRKLNLIRSEPDAGWFQGTQSNKRTTAPIAGMFDARRSTLSDV